MDRMTRSKALISSQPHSAHRRNFSASAAEPRVTLGSNTANGFRLDNDDSLVNPGARRSTELEAHGNDPNPFVVPEPSPVQPSTQTQPTPPVRSSDSRNALTPADLLAFLRE